jgi:hypothetical protein
MNMMSLEPAESFKVLPFFLFYKERYIDVVISACPFPQQRLSQCTERLKHPQTNKQKTCILRTILNVIFHFLSAYLFYVFLTFFSWGIFPSLSNKTVI